MYILVGRPTEDLTMKKIWKNEDGVSPVIAVILMVAITVVLAAVLYVMVSGMMSGTSSTPTGALTFGDAPQGGATNYTGQVIKVSPTTKWTDCSITILDGDGSSASQDPIDSGTSFATTGGLPLTYTDSNGDGNINSNDIWTVTGGAEGDIIRLIHNPTGGQIADFILK
jgi:flagellin-like protein